MWLKFTKRITALHLYKMCPSTYVKMHFWLDVHDKVQRTQTANGSIIRYQIPVTLITIVMSIYIVKYTVSPLHHNMTTSRIWTELNMHNIMVILQVYATTQNSFLSHNNDYTNWPFVETHIVVTCGMTKCHFSQLWMHLRPKWGPKGSVALQSDTRRLPGQCHRRR